MIVLAENFRSNIITVFLAVAALLFSCDPPSKESLSIQWKDGQAVAIHIPKSLLKGADIDSISISRQKSDVRILGDFREDGNSVAFVPLIPFTRGLRYDIVEHKKIVSSVTIDEADVSDAPLVGNIFPSADTVPENLLKVYIKFSKPMRSVIASEHVFLLKDNGDTVKNAFLDLDPPLWNSDQTMLTLWFDPGRIKRGLQPNLKLGAPMMGNNRYTVVVNDDWTDLNGLRLHQKSKKQYTTISRDSVPPNPSLWTISKPSKGTRDPLKIVFHEALDYSLLKDVFHIRDEKMNSTKGEFIVEEKEGAITFTPSAPWSGTNYFLKIETRLEDLAGNNLNKPFDRDVKTVPDNGKKNGSEITLTITLK